MTKNKKDTTKKQMVSFWQILLVFLIIILAGGFYVLKYSKMDTVQTAPQQNFTPDTLVVIRSEDIQNSLPSLNKTITNKEIVIELYKQILALPYFPGGNLKCPEEYPINYILNFFQSHKQILTANFNPTGCRIMQISNSEPRWLSNSQGDTFINSLQQVLGFTNTEFYGQ